MGGDMEESIESAVLALERIQTIDPASISRTETLGKAFDFSESVSVLKKIIDFFKRIPSEGLMSIPDNLRASIENEANSTYSLYERVMSFNPVATANAAGERQGLMSEFSSRWRDVFNNLFPVVNYLTSLQTDIAAIEREAQASIAHVKSEAETFQAEMETMKSTAQRILTEVRAVAAEAGVSQQATYFGDESASHATEADTWQRYAVGTAIGLGIFAAVSVLAGKYFLVPEDTYQSIQLALSKVLIFSTIASMLFLCTRTLAAHRHNAVVNKHRQNALLTFNALAEAASSDQIRDVVLTHASACVFEPQDSGFSKAGQGNASQTAVEILPRLISPGKSES